MHLHKQLKIKYKQFTFKAQQHYKKKTTNLRNQKTQNQIKNKPTTNLQISANSGDWSEQDG